MVSHRQWRNSIFICFLLFVFQCKKGGGLLCVWFATAAIQFQLLKRRGPFEQSHLFEWAVLLSDKLDPSTSLMCPVGDGGGLCLCVRRAGDKTWEKRVREAARVQVFLSKHCNIPQKRQRSCHSRTKRFSPLWICNDNWIGSLSASILSLETQAKNLSAVL